MGQGYSLVQRARRRLSIRLTSPSETETTIIPSALIASSRHANHTRRRQMDDCRSAAQHRGYRGLHREGPARTAIARPTQELMRLPVIQGTIKRRILANFRVDPEIMRREIPSRFVPKLQDGLAIAGICLIRLEHVRPRALPEIMGLSSENAAHRVAVMWDEGGETREGVFISRRDTNSQINHLLGGRIFPGEHHQAAFSVEDSDSKIMFRMKSEDAKIRVRIDAQIAATLPSDSVFSSLAQASSFFEKGSVGYSEWHTADDLYD